MKHKFSLSLTIALAVIVMASLTSPAIALANAQTQLVSVNLDSTKLQTPLPCVPPPSGNVSWWPGDDNANDIVGGNNGALLNGASFTAGMVGQAFNFDGTSEVRIADGPNLNVQFFTIDAWVFPTLVDGAVDIIINKEDINQNPIQYEIGIRGSGYQGLGTIPEGNLAFYMGGISGLPDEFLGWVNGGGSVPLNAWSHVALTFNGNSARAYINGVLTREVTGLIGSVNISSGPFKIGSRSLAFIDAFPNSGFDGIIDEVELFNRALATSEIQAVFNAGLAGKCKPEAGGPYDVTEGGVILVEATRDDDPGGTLTYAWDLDNNGSFETPSQSVNFFAANLDGPSSHTITVQVTDEGGLTATASTTVEVLNVAPTADFISTPGTLFVGQSATLAFSNPFDPSGADTTAGFHYSYDCTNDGSFELSDTVATSYACAYPASGTFTSRGRIHDKDGDFTDYTVQITVLTPRQGTAGLIDQVQSLVAQGVLSEGHGNALIAKLNGAIKQLERGKTKTAVNELQAFISQVNSFMNSTPPILMPAEGQPLIDAANAIIIALGG